MKVGTRLSLSFFVMGFFIISASVLSVQNIKSKLKEIGEFHSAALYSMQAINSKLSRAVGESFSYVVSGEKREKEEFLEWAEHFNQTTKKYIKVAGLDRPGEEAEKAIVGSIVSIQSALVQQAKAMFIEYETTGAVSNETFQKYEKKFELIKDVLDQFVEIEKGEVELSQETALETIQQLENTIYRVGFFSLILAVGLGFYVSKTISDPLLNLQQAATTIGRGEFTTKIEIVSQDEIGQLTHVFNEMVQDLKASSEKLIRAKEEAEHSSSVKSELNKKLLVKMRELEQSNQDLGSFAAITSHDLREPLRKVINFSNLLARSQSHFNLKEKTYLEKIENGGQRMLNLIDDIMSYSRLSGHTVQFERINLNGVILEAKRNLSLKIEESGGSVDFGEFPAIDANKTQMIQLFQNLIDNGLKYRKNDLTPVVQLNCHAVTDGIMEFRVRDNGIGFDEKYLEKIFQPFERLITDTAVRGTGMGLAICNRVVLCHGGEITAESKLREGSTFIVRLPLRHVTV